MILFWILTAVLFVIPLDYLIVWRGPKAFWLSMYPLVLWLVGATSLMWIP